MKRLVVIAAVLLVAAAAAGCRRHKVIPDKVLGEIFHDAMLTNAYIDNHGVKTDSLNIYEPIFARYGYTTEDVQYTINNFSRRKSARLSDVAEHMILMFDREADRLEKQVAVLDTIDNAARRRYTRTLLLDTMVRARKAADTVLLRFEVDDVAPGQYAIAADYSLDSLDKASGRRYRIFWQRDDGTEKMGAGGAMIKRSNRNINHVLTVGEEDGVTRLVVDLNNFGSQKRPQPVTRMTVERMEITYTPPIEACVDSLYREQLGVRIFSDSLIRMIEGPQGGAGGA